MSRSQNSQICPHKDHCKACTVLGMPLPPKLSAIIIYDPQWQATVLNEELAVVEVSYRSWSASSSQKQGEERARPSGALATTDF